MLSRSECNIRKINFKLVDLRNKKISLMEIEAFNGYTPNYLITMSSSTDHGNIYGYQPNYNYQYNASDNLVWSNSENFVNPPSDLSTGNISSPTSFYFQNQTINSTTNSDEVQPQIDNNCAKGKRGRRKGGCRNEKIKTTRRSKRSSSLDKSQTELNPTVMKKRRLAANARERRRMNGLNSAFDR